MWDREAVFEWGVVIMAAGLVAGLGILFLGGALGRGREGRGRTQHPPAVGTVSSERHQHISTVAAR